MAYGRKLKGTSRRVPITVHTPLDRLDAIDEYVEERRQQEGKAYSRSDFYEEAAALYLISIHVPSWGTTANFHKYSLFFYAINIIFLLFIIPSLFSLVLFMLLF